MKWPASEFGLEPAFRWNTAERVYTIQAAHNPEVAGSNPAPATHKGPGNGAFSLGAKRMLFTSASGSEPARPATGAPAPLGRSTAAVFGSDNGKAPYRCLSLAYVARAEQAARPAACQL